MSEDTPIPRSGISGSDLSGSDDPGAEIELSEEDTALFVEDEPSVPLRERLRRPWPRPVVALVAAVAAAVATALVVRPEPAPPPVVLQPSPPSEAPQFIIREGEDVFLGKDGWLAVGPDGGRLASLEVDAANKLGALSGTVLVSGTAYSLFPAPFARVEKGWYTLEIACASDDENVSLRIELAAKEGEFFFEKDVRCDAGPSRFKIELDRATELTLTPVGPGAALSAYAFWFARGK